MKKLSSCRWLKTPWWPCYVTMFLQSQWRHVLTGNPSLPSVWYPMCSTPTLMTVKIAQAQGKDPIEVPSYVYGRLWRHGTRQSTPRHLSFNLATLLMDVIKKRDRVELLWRRSCQSVNALKESFTTYGGTMNFIISIEGSYMDCHCLRYGIIRWRLFLTQCRLTVISHWQGPFLSMDRSITTTDIIHSALILTFSS